MYCDFFLSIAARVLLNARGIRTLNACSDDVAHKHNFPLASDCITEFHNGIVVTGGEDNRIKLFELRSAMQLSARGCRGGDDDRMDVESGRRGPGTRLELHERQLIRLHRSSIRSLCIVPQSA